MARRILLVLPLLLLTLPGLAQEAKPKTKQQPGFLGVSMQPWVVPDTKPEQALIEVTAVVPGSAAARAGLDIGDVLVELDGKSLAGPKDQVLSRFAKTIKAKGMGARMTLLVRRRTVSAQTFVDEQAQGPAKDASGHRAARRALPDLDELLKKHPERLVGVRARAYLQKRRVTVVLGARPGTTTRPLPANASLRPALAAAKLVPAAALAKRVIGLVEHGQPPTPLKKTYAALLARFEQDERIEDPFRLKTVRYLHRDPLKLANATRGLAGQLQKVLTNKTGPSLARLLRTVRTHLDAPSSKSTLALLGRPAPQAGVAAHAGYVLSSVRMAERWIGRATARLTKAERAHLVQYLPSLAARFAEGLYLHTDPDPERWGHHARVIKLLPKVDRSGLLHAMETLLPLSDAGYLKQLASDLRAAEQRGQRGSATHTAGRVLYCDGADVVVGGSGNNVYRHDYKVIIDLGGDDQYHVPVGGARPNRPAAVCIDLSGDDRYQTTQPFGLGAALLGVGLLIDAAGNDSYTTNQSFSQGAALAGAAVLLDVQGDDVYRGIRYAQGAALCQGMGVLLDGGGDDLVLAGVYAQGFGGPGAFGGLVARGGNDRYSATGLYVSHYKGAVVARGSFRGFSQGSSVGFRHQASGGIGVLVDDGGKDVYEAGNFSQGGGYFFGWGMLADLGTGDDRYEGSRYAQSFSAHSALGSLLDTGGNDTYRGWVGACNSAAWDLSATVFLEDGGDDRYLPGPGFSLGASAHNGFSLFVDRGGRDTYGVAPGRAGPNTYHGGPSVSVFVDAGGQPDQYRGGGLSDGRAAVQGHTGVLIDLPGSLERATDALLRRLLPRPKK